MDGRSRFLHRCRAFERWGDAGGSRRGAYWTAHVAARRVFGQGNPLERDLRGRGGHAGDGVPKAWDPYRREKPLASAAPSVPQTDAGGLAERCQGERENLRQGTRQHDPVTSGEGGPPAVEAHAARAVGGRSE